MTNENRWAEPGRTVRELLLTEPGSRVEGPTERVLAVLFETAWRLLLDELGPNHADAVALRYLARVHEDLAHAGYITRDTGAPTDAPPG
jgi:hypothetical protein